MYLICNVDRDLYTKSLINIARDILFHLPSSFEFCAW